MKSLLAICIILGLMVTSFTAMLPGSAVAGSSNNKTVSPTGYVAAGQTLNYTIRYENGGGTTAYGAYITDVLNAGLDDSTLIAGGNCTYDNVTRTLRWQIGDLAAGASGNVTFSVRVRADAAPATTINNFATIHFPSVPSHTQTNTVSSVVGQAQSVTSIAEKQDVDGTITVETKITRVKDAGSGETISNAPIGCYEAKVLYNTAGIKMLTIRPGVPPFDNPEYYIIPTTGQTNIAQYTLEGTEPPTVVANLVPRLIGSTMESYDLEVTFDLIADPNGNLRPQVASQVLEFQRGDINEDGVVNIIDAMFGAQYLAELREDVHLLNMASVLHDSEGDKPDIRDCMYIAQYAVGLRNSYFELGGETAFRFATKDNYIAKQSPTSNKGNVTSLMIQAQNASNCQRALLEFDFSSLPSEAILLSAQLELYYYGNAGSNPTGLRASAYKLTRTNWTELGSTWNTYDGTTGWTTSGGDYVTSSPSGGQTVFPSSYGWMTWDVRDIVRDAIDNVGGKVELLVRFDNETPGTNYSPLFYAMQYNDLAYVPGLTVKYLMP